MTLFYDSLNLWQFSRMVAAMIPIGRLNKVYCIVLYLIILYIVLYLIILCILITSVNQLGWLSSDEERPEKISKNLFNLYT